ncbi:MAG: VCBS repeat-containing protein [bacterium]|nr:VCBS repeat-containing protein [bacterium]
MKTLFTNICAWTLLAGAAFGQSQELYHIDRPTGANFAWREAMVSLDDLNGDGVPELLISGSSHGGGEIATVHSGATGDLMFHLTVPAAALFYGDGFTSLADRNGDGIADIVMLGSRSGAGNSFEGELRIHSGADGSNLFTFRPPVGMNFVAHAQSFARNLGDMNGDGFEDILCRTNGTLIGPTTYSLMSSADGQPIYSIVIPSGRTSIEGAVLLADQDGDGRNDLGFTQRASNSAQAFLVIASGATGQTIREFSIPELMVRTGNTEPLISVSDRAGSQALSVAYGGVFQGAMGRISAVHGSVQWSSTCDLSTDVCFGSRLLDVGDLNDDGNSDLVALETGFTANGALGLQVIDGQTGEVLSEESLPNLVRGYVHGPRLIAMPKADPQGFPTFAIAEDLNNRVSIRRLIPEIGRLSCTAKPNSTGLGAGLHAHGSTDKKINHLELTLENAPPGSLAIFAYGDSFNRILFGEGVLCIAGHGGRLSVGQVDSMGRLSMPVDLNTHGFVPGAWTLQSLFRDGTELNSSDSITIKF